MKLDNQLLNSLLTKEEALGFYMELESFYAEVACAGEHLRRAQMALLEPIVKEAELRIKGKTFPRRPDFDQSIRSTVTGLVSGILLQLGLVSNTIEDCQMLCAEIAPDCQAPTTVN